MKLPENMSEIVGKRYTDQKDDEGHFVHGGAPAMEYGYRHAAETQNHPVQALQMPCRRKLSRKSVPWNN